MAGVTGMPTPAAGYPMDAPGLENLVAYHPGFVSGSAPDGEEGLDTLASLGVRTIVSVDGAAPEVEAARERGMRYIHLPVGYDGFDDERRLQLVRGVLDGLEKGAVYIHCHHGMHRSAGAAAAVSVGAGWSSPEAAIERMRVSGTSPRYRGLYRCAAQSTRIDAELIESVDPDLPEVDRPDDFVELMIGMDLALEHLQLVAEAGWIPPVSHPDLVPAAEAGRLADLLRFASEGDRALQEPDGALLKCVHSAKLPGMTEHSVLLDKVEQRFEPPVACGGRPTEQKLRWLVPPFSTEHWLGTESGPWVLQSPCA